MSDQRETLISELRATIRIHEQPHDVGGCEGECVNCDLLRRCLALLVTDASPQPPQGPCGKQINTGTGSTNCRLHAGHGGYCSQHPLWKGKS